MFIQTHRLIGRIICRTLFENNGIKINGKAFKYGCIKPDISPKLSVMAHEKEGSFEFICEKIERLEKLPMPENKKELKVYSIELGIIIHFITDYFCAAHNYDKYRKIPEHFIYENKLAKNFPKIVNDEYFRIMWNMTYKNLSSVNVNIINFVEELHKEYSEHQTNVYIDIRYSLEACMVVASSIVSKAINNASIAA